MKTYLLTGKKRGGKVLLHYNANGFLTGINGEEAEEVQLRWLYRNIPNTEERLNEMKTQFKSFLNIEPQVLDTSFESFWAIYNYKVGKKAQAERLWESMSIANRSKAISYIQRYRQHCTLNNVAMAYPTTYLNQRYYDND